MPPKQVLAKVALLCLALDKVNGLLRSSVAHQASTTTRGRAVNPECQRCNLIIVPLVEVSRVFLAPCWRRRGSRRRICLRPFALINDPWIETDDKDEDDDDKNDVAEMTFSSTSLNSDWLEAEFTLRSAPSEPHPELLPHQVATLCCRSLQWVDYPTQNAGLKRCYRFFTTECRKLVTGRQYTTDESPEQFYRYAALSPALQPFMGATRVTLGDMTLTPERPPHRGALASFPIVIQGATVLALLHASGMVRNGVTSAPPTTHMVMRLEQQRRPPHEACWMVREVLDVRHAFAGDMGNAHVGG